MKTDYINSIIIGLNKLPMLDVDGLGILYFPLLIRYDKLYSWIKLIGKK